MLKMFSNFMPHLTEEIYMDYFAEKEGMESLHVSGYLDLGKVENEQLIKNGEEVMNIVSGIRQSKSENKISLKTFIQDITVTTKNADFVRECEVDIKAVGSINEIKLADGDFAIEFGEIIPDEQN